MQGHKVHMKKNQFRIGDLAKELKVKKFVIRFWEKEFELKSDRSSGGQRFYTIDDLNCFITIKDLLYNQGFTIAGAKKQLETQLKQEQHSSLPKENFDNSKASKKAIEQAALHANQVTPAQKAPCNCKAIMKELQVFKTNLIDFKTLLNKQS